MVPEDRRNEPLPHIVCRALCASVLILALAACGGGSDSAAPAAAPPLGSTCSAGSAARLALPAQAQAGRNAELALLSCGPVLDRVHWTQTAGPAIALTSARSQALSLEPPQAATYRFALRFQDEHGTGHQGEAALVVAPDRKSVV